MYRYWCSTMKIFFVIVSITVIWTCSTFSNVPRLNKLYTALNRCLLWNYCCSVHPHGHGHYVIYFHWRWALFFSSINSVRCYQVCSLKAEVSELESPSRYSNGSQTSGQNCLKRGQEGGDIWLHNLLSLQEKACLGLQPPWSCRMMNHLLSVCKQSSLNIANETLSVQS